jgi:hypothetical protein
MQAASIHHADQAMVNPPAIYASIQRPIHIGKWFVAETAIQRIEELNQLLENPHLSPQERMECNEELFELLLGKGPAVEKYGQICGAITQKTPYGLPPPPIPAEFPSSQSAWAPGSEGYVPTNDWFIQVAAFPNMPRVMNCAGVYNFWYATSRYQDDIAALYSQSIFNFHNDFENLQEVQKIHQLQADYRATKNPQDLVQMKNLQSPLQAAVISLVTQRNNQLKYPQQFPKEDIEAVAYFILVSQEAGDIAFPDGQTQWNFKPPTTNDEGIIFKTAVSFNDWEDPSDPNHAVVTPIYNQGFSFGAQGFNVASPYRVEWETTGDGVRKAAWGDQSHSFSVNVAQGSVFQSASYNNAVPTLKVGSTTLTEAHFVHSLSDGTREYQLQQPEGVYLFFGSSKLLLNGSAYTGNINAAFLPQGYTASLVSLLEAHANVVVVGQQSALLPGDQAEVSLKCTDLVGNPTANVPLIAQKRHLVEALENTQGKTPLSYITMNGEVDVYAGAYFIYQFASPGTTLDALPNLPNGSPALTKAQCDQYLLAPGNKRLKATGTIPPTSPLGKGIQEALNKQVTISLYDGGKALYSIATTYAFAQKILNIEGWSADQINQALDPLLKYYIQGLVTQASSFAYNKDWGTIVSKIGDYGNPNFLNDHIVQYGYWLYSMSLLYGTNQTAAQQFMNQTVTGTSYTYKDLGDLVASDIGQTGANATSPINRNFDFYSGHSWLGGIGNSGDGNNTESESEAAFGSMAIASWLKNTQPNSTQASLAHARWAVETQGLKDYFHVDATDAKCIYKNIAPTFAKNHLVMSMKWDGKFGDETFWGLNWDRILACEMMPAGAQMADNYYATASPSYIKNLATFIYQNWQSQGYDPDNNIQSALIAMVARFNAKWAKELLNKVPSGRFDNGTTYFIQQVIIDRYSNMLLHRL